jgi:glucosamine--fructose-6-phosphate aminotransferase (isomerizing)
MKPENVLARQIGMVEDYLASNWPEALLQAHTLKANNLGINQILLGGCGDSHHAAMGLELAFGEYTGLRTRAMQAMQLGRYAPSLSGGQHESTLVIAISASGEVARTIEALEIWRGVGALTLALTTNHESTVSNVAHHTLSLPPPDIPHGPGLLSYLGSLLLGYAVLASMLEVDECKQFTKSINQMPDLLYSWVRSERERAEQFALGLTQGTAVFLGSGAARGSAHFAAAKVVEAAGEKCWAQDTEEWAHLEYFCEPAEMPTMLLSSEGRSLSRENEILEAMTNLQRSIYLSRWQGGEGWSALEREALSPLALWVAPASYADTRSRILDQKPFRDFAGGRDRHEGGGPSRIRSSQRVGIEILG